MLAPYEQHEEPPELGEVPAVDVGRGVDVERERRRAERAERQAEQEGARAANLELGRAHLRRRGRKVSAKRQLARARALARLAAHNEEGLAAALRLTRETWQEVEVV